MTLPKLRSNKYFEFMEELCKKSSEVLGIEIIGFSDYNTVSYYWKKLNGKPDDRFVNTMSFSTLYERVYGTSPER